MYRLHREAGSKILEITITGFWDEATFESFRSDVQAIVARMTAGAHAHRVLVDVAEIAIQAQPIFEAFRELIRNEDPRPAKIAFYAPTALSRMQPRRLLLRQDIRLYPDRSEALSWLHS